MGEGKKAFFAPLRGKLTQLLLGATYSLWDPLFPTFDTTGTSVLQFCSVRVYQIPQPALARRVSFPIENYAREYGSRVNNPILLEGNASRALRWQQSEVHISFP